MKKVPDPVGQKSTDPTGTGSSSLMYTPACTGTKRKVEEMEAPEPLPDPLSEPVGSRAFARRGYNYEPSRSQVGSP